MPAKQLKFGSRGELKPARRPYRRGYGDVDRSRGVTALLRTARSTARGTRNKRMLRLRSSE